MRPVTILLFLILIASPCRAAVSILVQPGSSSETSFFTVTQNSPSPLLEVAGLSGYASAMSVPTAMFGIGSGDIPVTDIYGGLGASVATITESVSGQTFSLTGVQISVDPDRPSLLGFYRLFTLPTGYSTVQFEAETAGPVETTIPFRVLNPGVFTVEDTLFGTVTVTVIPEPSGIILLPGGMALLAIRRRRTA